MYIKFYVTIEFINSIAYKSYTKHNSVTEWSILGSGSGSGSGPVLSPQRARAPTHSQSVTPNLSETLTHTYINLLKAFLNSPPQNTYSISLFKNQIPIPY